MTFKNCCINQGEKWKEKAGKINNRRCPLGANDALKVESKDKYAAPNEEPSNDEYAALQLRQVKPSSGSIFGIQLPN